MTPLALIAWAAAILAAALILSLAAMVVAAAALQIRNHWSVPPVDRPARRLPR